MVVSCAHTGVVGHCVVGSILGSLLWKENERVKSVGGVRAARHVAPGLSPARAARFVERPLPSSEF